MFNVWSALNEPTRELLAQIKTELDTLSDKYDELKAIEDAQAVTIETMQGKIAELEQKIEVEKDITEYAFETPVHAGEFMYIQYGRIYQATEDYVTPADDGTKTVAELFAEDIDAGRLIELRPSSLYSVPNPNPGETTTDPVTPDPQDPQDPDPQQDPQDP
jgi:hypothetical protein